MTEPPPDEWWEVRRAVLLTAIAAAEESRLGYERSRRIMVVAVAANMFTAICLLVTLIRQWF